MANKCLIFVFLTVLSFNYVHSLWDFAVTINNKIIFYDVNWSEITTAAHQFNGLSAIAFDESEEKIYFNDQSHNNGSIFSLKISQNEDSNHFIEKVLTKTQNESIQGMAFDPVDRQLYWTDAMNKRIYRLSIDDNYDDDDDGHHDDISKTNTIKVPTVLFDFSNETIIPEGISIDICRRKLYWTNSNHKNPSIERSSLNGGKREVIVSENLYKPHGIVVDQYSDRIFWVVDQQGSHFSVESANLDGTDRQTIFESLNNVPFNLAVTRNSIYWTDHTHNSVWNISKTVQTSSTSTTTDPFGNHQNKVQSYKYRPKSIIARNNFLTNMENHVDCRDNVKRIKSRLLQSEKINLTNNINTNQMLGDMGRNEKQCLNDGDYNPRSGGCICKLGFIGDRCETNECHNFCVYGTCDMTAIGGPECICMEGFYGRRCEIFKCTDYCLNNGQCTIENDQPACNCPDTHVGKRCERNVTELCQIICRYGEHGLDWNIPFECAESCEDDDTMIVPYSDKRSLNDRRPNPQQLCSDNLNKTVLIGSAGIVTSLVLVLLIVISIRRLYKPARPRIKKTFVVQKKISQTPLTSRPLATEQCEITIENCCNMNICDTPCFDPKLLQQNMSCDSNTKEDKKILINNMDDDLY